MIENVFSQLQSFVNNKIQTDQINDDNDLYKYIIEACQAVTEEQCNNYYRRIVDHYYVKCADVNYNLE
jgi:hypothetical protein